MLSQGTDTDANGASAASPPTDPELEAARKAERERRAVKVSSISHGMIKHHAQDMGLGSAEDPWQWCAACRQLCVPKVSSLTAQCVHPYSCTCIAMHIHGHIHRTELETHQRATLTDLSGRAGSSSRGGRSRGGAGAGQAQQAAARAGEVRAPGRGGPPAGAGGPGARRCSSCTCTCSILLHVIKAHLTLPAAVIPAGGPGARRCIYRQGMMQMDQRWCLGAL